MNYSILSISHIAKIICLVIVINFSSLSQQDTLSGEQVNDTVFVMSKSPWLSVLFSAALPGSGQIYNESYWKAPVIWGVGAWLVYNWIDLNNNYKSNRDLYLSTGNTFFLNRRTFYRDERDLFTIYMILTYFLNLVDAYVDAHLFDFTVEEDFMTRMPKLSVKLFFR